MHANIQQCLLKLVNVVKICISELWFYLINNFNVNEGRKLAAVAATAAAASEADRDLELTGWAAL